VEGRLAAERNAVTHKCAAAPARWPSESTAQQDEPPAISREPGRAPLESGLVAISLTALCHLAATIQHDDCGPGLRAWRSTGRVSP
jgi:hypothetical protein